MSTGGSGFLMSGVAEVICWSGFLMSTGVAEVVGVA